MCFTGKKKKLHHSRWTKKKLSVQISRNVKNYSLLRVFIYAGNMRTAVHMIGDNSQILYRYKAYADKELSDLCFRNTVPRKLRSI